MRVIFLFFLLVNAAYFYTHSDLFNHKTGPVILKEQKLPEGVERLTLLRERGLGTSKPITPIEINKAPSDESNEPNKEANNQEESKSKAPEKEKPKSIPKPKFTAKPEPIKSAKAACFTLGPFNKSSTATKASNEISALGASVEIRPVSQRKPRGYWVYLPAFKTYEAARRRVDQLKKIGLKDLFIMGKGEYKNAVSLGLFKREEAADERFQQVKKMGLSVKKETQYQVKKQIWLDLTVPGNKTSTIASLTEIEEQYSKTNLTQRKCE